MTTSRAMGSTPAWPVAASAGGDTNVLTSQDHVHVMSPEGGYCADCGDNLEDETPNNDRLSRVEASLDRIEKTLAVLAVDALTTIPTKADQE